MNNATFESILAVFFTLMVVVLPLFILGMIWPDGFGHTATVYFKWIDLSLLHGLQSVTSSF